MVQSVIMEKNVQKTFWWAIGFTFVIKCLIALAIPITSDEAYFYIWANNPDFGYYDHPPMIGWILTLFLYIGRSELILRLPAILTTIFIGIGIYWLLKPLDQTKAYIAALVYLISPLNVLYVPVSTDTPVILFSFVSAYFLKKALDSDKNLMYFLSGIFLGMAFLSKYFAALLGFSYLIYFLFSEKRKKKTTGFLILYSSIIPFVLLNLYWNYTHSWANIMFNVFSRNQKAPISIKKIGLFIITELYLITPPIIVYLIKKKNKIIEGLKKTGNFKLFIYCFAVPMLIFFMLSFKKRIGLHWALAFYPFLFTLLFFIFENEELSKIIKYMMIFTIIHLFIVGSLLSTPLKYIKHNKDYNMIVMGMRPEKVIKHLKLYEKDFQFATESYADSAVIGYYYDRYFFVFGTGSHYGRQDDIITDFGKLDKKNMLILKKSKPEDGKYNMYFKKVEVNEITVEEAMFYLVLGYEFKYEAYRDKVLKEIRQKYYNFPAFLPVKKCYIKSKYFQKNGNKW